ncbi:MAG: MoaD/ThiS family protein [Myxococcota bacterium]
MQVQVRYFAALREKRGTTMERVAVTPGETLQALYERLFPGPADTRMPVAYARNHMHAKPSETIEDGDEIAFLPPVGGG